MEFSIAVAALIIATSPSRIVASSPVHVENLTDINALINKAFPMWEVDEDGNRVKTTPCTVDSCEWNPFYVTGRYDGLHPDFGGHPTENDVKYVFFASSPFFGQPYAGTNRHCPLDAPADIKAAECAKLVTLTDDGPDGPGHIPPHIALASVSWSLRDNLFSMDDMFDYDSSQCRIIPDVLFKMIRHFYLRTEGEKVAYPKPFVKEGGDYPFEFPAGNGLSNQRPPYAAGSAHWCTEEFLATGHWTSACPYVFEGPDAGKYRHPHIAFAALEVHLANITMPHKCAVTWLQNNPDFLDPERVTTDKAFPVMSNDDADPRTVENWIGQPVLPWTYDPGDAKDADLMYANDSALTLHFDKTHAVSGAFTAATGVASALSGSVIFLAYM